MTFIFEGLLGASIALATIYLLLAGYTYKKLLWLQSNSTPGLNTRKLFVMNCLLTAILRFMSFTSMALLDLGSVDFNVHSERGDDDARGNGEFFDKATLVLFDFPDFCCISAYMLLIVVWAESFLKSRRHWLSSFQFRKVWMLGYFVFNIVLYGTQTALYSLLFIPQVNQKYQMDMIYITLAVFNLILPIFWCLVYLYLAIRFAGFPDASPEAMSRLRSLSRLGTMWTAARLGWGIVALTTVIQGWLTEVEKSKLFYSVVLSIVFILSEVLPIILSLQKSVIQRLSEEAMPVRNILVKKDTTGYGFGAVEGLEGAEYNIRHQRDSANDSTVALLSDQQSTSDNNSHGFYSNKNHNSFSNFNSNKISGSNSPTTFGHRNVHGNNNSLNSNNTILNSGNNNNSNRNNNHHQLTNMIGENNNNNTTTTRNSLLAGAGGIGSSGGGGTTDHRNTITSQTDSDGRTSYMTANSGGYTAQSPPSQNGWLRNFFGIFTINNDNYDHDVDRNNINNDHE